MRIGAILAFLISLLILLDRFMQSLPWYMHDTNGRPVATVGSGTPVHPKQHLGRSGLDTFTHLLLPTLSLLLISFASTRATRGRGCSRS